MFFRKRSKIWLFFPSSFLFFIFVIYFLISIIFFTSFLFVLLFVILSSSWNSSCSFFCPFFCSFFSMPNFRPLLEQLQNSDSLLSKEDLMKIKRSFVRDQKIAKIPSNIQLLAQYKQLLKEWEMKQDDSLEMLLKKRPIRS